MPFRVEANIPRSSPWRKQGPLRAALQRSLENALRACRRLKAEDRAAFIEVEAREKNGWSFLQFVNPCPKGVRLRTAAR